MPPKIDKIADGIWLKNMWHDRWVRQVWVETSFLVRVETDQSGWIAPQTPSSQPLSFINKQHVNYKAALLQYYSRYLK